MPGLIDNVLAHSILDAVWGSQALVVPATWYLAALKAGDVEVTAAGYARLAVTNSLANFPAASARQKFLATVQGFVAANPGVDWGMVESIGFYTVAAAGTRQVKVTLAGAALNFTGTAATDLVKSVAHGYIDNQRVRVEALAGLPLPTGLATATDYYVFAVDADTFKLRAASGGAAIDLTADGAGLVYAWRSKGVSDGDILNFNANDLSLAFA